MCSCLALRWLVLLAALTTLLSTLTGLLSLLSGVALLAALVRVVLALLVVALVVSLVFVLLVHETLLGLCCCPCGANPAQRCTFHCVF